MSCLSINNGLSPHIISHVWSVLISRWYITDRACNLLTNFTRVCHVEPARAAADVKMFTRSVQRGVKTFSPLQDATESWLFHRCGGCVRMSCHFIVTLLFKTSGQKRGLSWRDLKVSLIDRHGSLLWMARQIARIMGLIMASFLPIQIRSQHDNLLLDSQQSAADVLSHIHTNT